MDINLPQLAEGIETGTVVSVLVKEGARVKKEDTLVELETAKAIGPVPSPQDGIVGKIFVKIGDEVHVGQRILTLSEADDGGEARGNVDISSEGGEKSKPNKPDIREEHASASPSPFKDDPPKPGISPPASPSIRKMARDLGIDLARVRGAGPGGRIQMDDMRNYIRALQADISRSKEIPGSKSSVDIAKSIDFSKWGPVTKTPVTSLRKTVSRAMLESWNSIPRVTQFGEADITAIMGYRKKYSTAFDKKGCRLTLTPFILTSVSSTLKKHPIFNSSLDDNTQEIITKNYIHIGVAVDTKDGLIVPVIRDVDKKTMVEIATQLEVLAEKTRNRKVTAEELYGGSFTISNQGGIGGDHFTPVVYKPQVAILGVGRASLKPRVVKGKITPRLVIPLGVSYDHRVIDGADAARFMVDLISMLEKFDERLLSNIGNNVKMRHFKGKTKKGSKR